MGPIFSGMNSSLFDLCLKSGIVEDFFTCNGGE